MTPHDRLFAFAQRLASARGLHALDTRHLYARVERLTSGYHRGGEWRATSHLLGSVVRLYGHESVSTVDSDAGVYAHGPTADAAVDAAIAAWRERMAWHHANAVRECARAHEQADRWAAIVEAVSS